MAFILVFTKQESGERWEQSRHRTFDAAVAELSRRHHDPMTKRRLPFYVNRAARDVSATVRYGNTIKGVWTVEQKAGK